MILFIVDCDEEEVCQTTLTSKINSIMHIMHDRPIET